MDPTRPELDSTAESQPLHNGGRNAALVLGPVVVIVMGVAGIIWTSGGFAKWESIVLVSGGIGLASALFTAWKTQRNMAVVDTWTRSLVVIWLLILVVFTVIGLLLLRNNQVGQPLIARIDGNLDAILPICLAGINLSSRFNFSLNGHRRTNA